MQGRISFKAVALAIMFLAVPASAQDYYPPVPPPSMWWGTSIQGQPLVCGYSPGWSRRSPQAFFAYPGMTSYNAIAYGALMDLPTYGPPPEGAKETKKVASTPHGLVRLSRPYLFGKRAIVPSRYNPLATSPD